LGELVGGRGRTLRTQGGGKISKKNLAAKAGERKKKGDGISIPQGCSREKIEKGAVLRGETGVFHSSIAP